MPQFDETIRRILHLGNIFDGTLQPTPPINDPTTAEGAMSFDPVEGNPMAPMQAPMNTANQLMPDYGQMIQEHIGKYPARRPPGIVGKLAATLAGFGGGPQAAMNIMDAPYQRDVEEWTNKMKGLQTGALAGYRGGSLAVRNAANEMKQFRLDNPDFNYKILSDGQIVALHKTDPTKSLVTPYNTGQLGAFEQQELGLERIDAETAAKLGIMRAGHGYKATEAEQKSELTITEKDRQHRQALERLRTGHGYDVNIQEMIGGREEAKHDYTMEQIKERGRINTSNTPSQQKIAMHNRAREMSLKYPELDIQITTEEIRVGDIPSKGRIWSDSDEAIKTYNEVVDYIRGSDSTDPKRQEAIQRLEEGGYEVTEESIRQIMDQL